MTEEVNVREFEVSTPVAEDLVDPYTGDRITVVGRVAGPVVTFSAPKAFTLAEPQDSIERLYARASMRNGVEGVASHDDSLKCAYTGEHMSLERTPSGKWYFSGGFNPRMARMSLSEFVRLASGGRVSPGSPATATSVPSMESEKPEVRSTDAVGEELQEISEHVCREIGADSGRVTVSMAGKTRKRR